MKTTFLKSLFVLFVAAGVCGSAAAEEKEITNSIGMKLVRIEPGSFRMGQDGPRADYSTMRHAEKCDDADWDERPVHRVTITTALHMAATEVTVAQYRQFKPELKDAGADDEAVTGVTWFDAVKYCEWLSAREGRSTCCTATRWTPGTAGCAAGGSSWG